MGHIYKTRKKLLKAVFTEQANSLLAGSPPPPPNPLLLPRRGNLSRATETDWVYVLENSPVLGALTKVNVYPKITLDPSNVRCLEPSAVEQILGCLKLDILALGVLAKPSDRVVTHHSRRSPPIP